MTSSGLGHYNELSQHLLLFVIQNSLNTDRQATQLTYNLSPHEVFFTEVLDGMFYSQQSNVVSLHTDYANKHGLDNGRILALSNTR